ncbi:PAS domain-containing protein [Candidatus Binatia bacterium]|nr:PAS domain-containing protein [Candidatus Binatia bacterium]
MRAGTTVSLLGIAGDDRSPERSEPSFRQIVDGIHGLVCTMDARGELEFVNQQIVDFTGRTFEELRDWQPLLHEEDRDEVVRRWSHAVATGLPYESEHRIPRADGVFRWFHVRGMPMRDASGSIVRWCVLLVDIDDRRSAEEVSKARERELRLLIDSFPGMVAVASADGQHEYANKRVMDYVGQTLAEAAGLGWLGGIHPDDREAVRAAWLRSVASAEPMDVQHRWRRFDGVYRWFHARVEPLFDENGRVIRWYGLLVDVDDRKRAEETLRRSEAQLAHVTRVTTMGELTASIAHEVNQPLTAIVNNANACLGLLPESMPDLHEVREALRDIVDDGDRASAIIARVRRLVKNAPFESVLLDLRDVVHDVVTLATHESTRRAVTVRVDLADDLPPVVGDRVQLAQVLMNLVVNAMDAMTTADEPRRVLVVRGRRAMHDGAARVALHVEDAGIGLSREAMERLFEPFYTTKANGLGMGLAISRSIVDAHGGRLWVEPHPDAGTIVSFDLPVATAMTADRG